jgi:hypothetical protein
MNRVVFYGSAVLVGALLGSVSTCAYVRRDRAAVPSSVARDSALVAATRSTVAAARIDTQYVHDTVEVTRTRTAYREIAAQPITITVRDTLIRIDTVEAVRAIVAHADSAIRACSIALVTCDQRVAAARVVMHDSLHLVRVDLADAATRRAKRAFHQGIVLGAGAVVAAGVAARVITR